MKTTMTKQGAYIGAGAGLVGIRDIRAFTRQPSRRRDRHQLRGDALRASA